MNGEEKMNGSCATNVNRWKSGDKSPLDDWNKALLRRDTRWNGHKMGARGETKCHIIYNVLCYWQIKNCGFSMIVMFFHLVFET